ncbi:signal sequence binding protein [Cryptococcus wingfieldii CBS 7118]|uniref:Vacuolar protein sorting/targeting protein 10 n=1 Tax=Cryptococcus wingfieldii CBS 7118 TaxID=1295528 RepID=A0A1E3I1V0_9TREE|nr:signal sequence binding protein [Cryptococcus wingfieldii CBS 7118]ODN82335.1 signal sequence binding protein [Cryptococcus wingfieldii CBS 7118]
MLLLPALLGVLISALAALAADPQVTVNRIENLPNRLFYFDDTPVVMYHDPAMLTVHRSEDEGKTWEQITGPIEGEAIRLVEHPHNNEMAFIIGRYTTHWVTYNRGATWQSFVTPRDASLGGKTLTFHSGHDDWILFQGVACESGGFGKWGGKTCWDETFYTTDAFRSEPQLLLSQTSQCIFARSSEAFVSAPEKLVFCVAFDQSQKPGSGGMHSIKESRLYSSEDWFENKKFVDLGIGKRARGVVGLGVVSKFMVVALNVADMGTKRAGGGDPMALYVSTDGLEWRQTQFPHSALPDLKENAYTIVESTTHSIAVDILTSPSANIGTLFVSSGEGTYFVEALADTNRNEYGIVDFEGLVGLEGVGIANVVANREEVVGWGEPKKIKSKITYDDGSSWKFLSPPAKNLNGDDWSCDTSDLSKCSLHVHSVSTPHNIGRVFSSTAPGYVMAVGSVGESLLSYDDCDTFLSTDAGLSWRQVQEGAHKYEFGDQGSVLVIVDDEQATDHVHYSYDGGHTWTQLDLGVTVRGLVLTTIPDSTSQKFILLGTLPRKDSGGGRHAMIQLDFAPLQTRQCTDDDFERWYARSGEGNECLMGHKQWYQRRKLDAPCYVGHKFEDPVGHEENCACADEDYECDFNYVRQDGECVAVGPEPVPPGTCNKPDGKYLGSSGYRRIPGNTCENRSGQAKDSPINKDCSDARPESGSPSHVVHEFESDIISHSYFPLSQTILIQLADSTVWQSSNEGFSWKQLYEDETFLAVIVHQYSPERAYLLTNTRKIYYTTDTGRSWNTMNVPNDPNTLGIPIIDFHPTKPDWIIFTGSIDCDDALSTSCRAIAHYSTEHGRRWRKIDEYVRICAWARDQRLKIDEREIICESYKNKKGSQISGDYNPMELIAGGSYYSKKNKVFDSVVGFASFSEYLLVAKLNEDQGTLSLQVSLDGYHFSEGQFPPNMKIENRAYTILESSTDAVFLHVTMHSGQNKEWGSIFKSNSNGTYYGLSLDYVNRNTAGYVDFEKMIGLDGIAVVNVVSNPSEADISGRKSIQSRITHNDGGSWKPLNPPAKDSLGQEYWCQSTSCSLQIHGYTERRDPKATYSSPSAVGLMLAVGNVGEELATYTDSDIFLTRDGGYSWEEVHKDAHMWEFGDSGSIVVLVNDEEATDHVLYTLDEGLTWQEYAFGSPLRVKTIQTVPDDTSRRFFLIGSSPSNPSSSYLVHLDFSVITQTKCELSIEDPNHDDFELWSPSESREDQCLFGRQTMYHRRIRDKNCYVGERVVQPNTIVRNCTCTASDFECEFNYRRDASGNCVLVDGAVALSSNTEYEQCDGYTDYWYERTEYRKIPYSSCEGGERPDQGRRHSCPGLIVGGVRRGALFWGSIAILPFAIAGLAGYHYYKKGDQLGSIRLGDHRAFGGSGGSSDGWVAVAASVPLFLVGVAQEGWAWVVGKVPFLDDLVTRRSNYRSVPIDEDAEVLGNYEDE